LVQEVVKYLTPELSARQIDWKFGDLPFVECDPGLIKQVFYNLLSNALKYTMPRTPAVIEVGYLSAEIPPAFFVKDNGVGFNMKYADKLFGVFQRLHRREDFEGVGVGLASVKRIVEKHGGRIWAEAEVDKGATFFFTLSTPAGIEGEPEQLLVKEGSR
jgi:light-regulated signal transduction histidine kinase (bacteriophytochrome)